MGLFHILFELQRVRKTVSAETVKQTTCEHCGAVYFATVAAAEKLDGHIVLGGIADERVASAQKRVRQRADAGWVTGACPQCGRLPNRVASSMLSKRIGVRLCVWLLVLPLLIVLVLGVAAASDQKTEREIQGWLPRHWPLLAAPLVVGGVVHAVWTARRSPNSDVQCARRLQRRPRGIWTSQEFDARQKVRRPSDMQVHACEYCGEEVWFKESQRGGLVECPHCSEMCDIPHVPA